MKDDSTFLSPNPGTWEYITFHFQLAEHDNIPRGKAESYLKALTDCEAQLEKYKEMDRQGESFISQGSERDMYAILQDMHGVIVRGIYGAMENSDLFEQLQQRDQRESVQQHTKKLDTGLKLIDATIKAIPGDKERGVPSVNFEYDQFNERIYATGRLHKYSAELMLAKQKQERTKQDAEFLQKLREHYAKAQSAFGQTNFGQSLLYRASCEQQVGKIDTILSKINSPFADTRSSGAARVPVS